MVLPAQTVLLDMQEQEGVNGGGSRKDPKQAGWFQKLLDFVTGGSI